MTHLIWNGDVFIALGALNLLACGAMLREKRMPRKAALQMLLASCVSLAAMLWFTVGREHSMELVVLALIAQVFFYQRFFGAVSARSRL